MPLDLQQRRATFDARTGGPQSQDLTFVLDTTIRIVGVALNGFDIGFTNGDHKLLRTQIDLDVISRIDNTAVVRVILSLRDASGDFDDPFSGFVDVLLIADRA